MLACLLGRQNHILACQLGWLALLRALLQRLYHTLQEDNLCHGGGHHHDHVRGLL